jgi:hypothetical protein
MNTVACLQFQDIHVFFLWALTNCRSNLNVTRPGIASTCGQPWAKRRIQELSWGPQSLIMLQLLHFYFNLYMSHGSKLNSVSKGVYWPCTSCKHNTGSIRIPESFSCVPATFLRMLLLPSFPSIRQQRHEIMKLELDSSSKRLWKNDENYTLMQFSKSQASPNLGLSTGGIQRASIFTSPIQ